MIAYSTLAKNARLQALVNLLQAGGDPGLLSIYGGTAPAPGEAVGGQPLICQLTLATTPGTVANGVLAFADIPEAMVVLDGVATWARFSDSVGAAVIDVDVGPLASTATIRLATTELYAGSLLRITSAIISEP